MNGPYYTKGQSKEGLLGPWALWNGRIVCKGEFLCSEMRQFGECMNECLLHIGACTHARINYLNLDLNCLLTKRQQEAFLYLS